MKTVVAAVALAAFGMVPATGVACEYNDASAAPVDIGLAPEPDATKVPAPIVAKAPVTAKVKKTADRTKTPAPEQKLAASAESPAR